MLTIYNMIDLDYVLNTLCLLNRCVHVLYPVITL